MPEFDLAEPSKRLPHPNVQCSDDTCWCQGKPLGPFVSEESMSEFDYPLAIKELAEARCRCGDCQGKGVRDRIAPPSCPKCAGTGYYEPFASLRIPCPNSGGRGKETKWHQTCVCGGRCWVPEPDREKACWRILQVVRTPAIVSLIMRNGLTVETALGAALVWVKEQHAVIS